MFQGLVGVVFRRVPTVDIPTCLEYLTTDADGRGVSIYQQSQSVVAAVQKFSQLGLLVDYPKVEKLTSMPEQQAGLVRALIVIYPANQAVNWMTVRVGSMHRLGPVDIREYRAKSSFDTPSFKSKGSMMKGVYADFDY